AEPIKPGQEAQLDTRNGIVQGKVRRVFPGAANGLVKVEVQIEGVLPSGAIPGLNVDGVIAIELLKDVLYVGRPMLAGPQSDGVLVKLDEGGQHASKVNVEYGRAGVQTLEVLGGLKAGDKVILSDMSAYGTKERVRLQ